MFRNYLPVMQQGTSFLVKIQNQWAEKEARHSSFFLKNFLSNVCIISI
jgi:hypothetical protein